MRRGLLAFAVLMSLTGVSVAQGAAKPLAFNVKDYPAEVQEALSYAPEECKDQGGGEATFAPDTVRRADLNGDGRLDYVVTFQDTQCSSYASAFCGTAGCTMEFLMTLPDGKIRSVFSSRIRGYEILPRKGTVRFQLHGSYCGRSGNPSCYKDRRITFKPFEFKEPE
jgi:hypothetical protein